MTEAQFQSRRELRDAESTSATPGQSQDLNFPPLTRSQLIAMGRITDETADLEDIKCFNSGSLGRSF